MSKLKVLTSSFLCGVLIFSLSIPAMSMEPMDEGMFIDAGYHLAPNLISQNYLLYTPIKQLYFPAKNSSPFVIKYPNLLLFKSVTTNLEKYIKDEKNGKLQECVNDTCTSKFQEINGITELELAKELVNSSYCFGTDPYVIASKVRQESKFDTRAISPTGAMGLTQMTEIGLEEVLDQLGHRGAKFAEPDVNIFIQQALSCYLGASAGAVFKTFPEIKTYKTKSGRIDYTPETIKSVKRWFSFVKNGTNLDKRLMIRKQIILGQTLLKVYLAYSYALSKNKNMTNIYNEALKMFNGDRIKVRYAKEVMKKSVPRNFL